MNPNQTAAGGAVPVGTILFAILAAKACSF